MSNLYYDADWTISLSNIPEITTQKDGAFTGNGKIGMYVSMSNISTSRTMISGNVQFNQIGKYKNNTLDGFKVNDIQFISNSSSNISYVMQHQKLSMNIGEVETRFSVMSNNQNIADVRSTVVPLRQYPYCVLQSVEFTPTSNMGALDIYHEIKRSDIINVQDYNNNVIYNENIYQDKGLYILNGNGYIGQSGQTSQICAAACYLFEESNITNLGFNIFNDKSCAYQKYRYTNISSNETYRFHVLSAMMTSYDFQDPLEEVKRILLNIAFKSENVPTLVQGLRDDNEKMWTEIWKGDIDIIPKNIITQGELADVYKVKRVVRHSLFNIFACLREAVNTEVNPLNLSYLDTNGNIFFDGDLWLIPALIFLKPNIARVLLEFKYKMMEQALQLSASFGYKGSKFPYKNDVVGYKNVYWDVISPLHISNNATIAINIWNYYRVTLDREWLLNKGYTMMKNIADFLVSYIKYNGVTGLYNVPNTLGLGKIISENHAFTINCILLSLKYITEVCHVLGYIPNPEWANIILRLQLPVETTSPNLDVIRYYDTYTGTTNVDILDNFIILLPYYSNMYFNDYSNRNNSAIQRNINYYSTKLDSAFEQHILNNMIYTGIYGVLAQTDNSKMVDFISYLDKVINENMIGVWGFMNNNNDVTMGNDVTMNAFLILIMLTCVCGLSIRGSTAPSNIVLEYFKIQDSLWTYMPKTWASINIGAIGKEERFVNISNKLPYI
jgi:trehalose/maltose hydrolase-like predicted phosphorylase